MQHRHLWRPSKRRLWECLAHPLRERHGTLPLDLVRPCSVCLDFGGLTFAMVDNRAIYTGGWFAHTPIRELIRTLAGLS